MAHNCSLLSLLRQCSHSLEVYKDLVCLVMSYSFSDPDEDSLLGQTMMVPFVDLLNHHSHHHTELCFLPTHLELVAVRDIHQVDPLRHSQLFYLSRRGRRS